MGKGEKWGDGYGGVAKLAESKSLLFKTMAWQLHALLLPWHWQCKAASEKVAPHGVVLYCLNRREHIALKHLPSTG